MKHLLFFIFLFFSTSSLYPEGFVSGTQVKTKTGFRSIEYIHSDSKVCTYDCAKKKQSYSKVRETYRSRVSYYIRLFFENRILDVAPDQKLSVSHMDDWVYAEQIVTNAYIRGLLEAQAGLVHAAYVFEPKDVYIFTLKKHHTFYVTYNNILVHNFDLSFVSAMPEVTMLVPFLAESAIAAAPTGNPLVILAACALAGGYCLYNWVFAKQKNKKEAKHIRRKLELDRQRMLEQEKINGVSSGGPNKDPKNNKKKKNEKKPPREYTQKDYKLLNDDAEFEKLSLQDRAWLIRNEENIKTKERYIRREAKRLGYKYIGKRIDFFNNHNQDVFQKGNNYITYDIDGHKGGFWKMFRRRVRERMGTFDLDLKIVLGA